MKKILSVFLLASIILLFGCNNQVEDNTKVINPLPETLNINSLENCTVAISLDKGDVNVSDSGNLEMDLTVYSYELYDMVDIASLNEDDIIVCQKEEIKINKLERLESGLVRINGGEENGGFDLISNGTTVYYEIGMNDLKSYYELGKITLPVSNEFEYIDESKPGEVVTYHTEAFVTDNSDIEYNFSPNNTSIVIENGNIIKMIKSYMQ